MKFFDIGLFNMALASLEEDKGYTLIEILKDADPGINYYHYDTKEDFEKDWETGRNELYKCDTLIPKHIVKQYGTSYSCLLSGAEFYIETNELYLVIDGKLKR